MRDALMFIVGLGAVPFALAHTWIGVLLWNWLSLMNPHRLSWGPAFLFPFAAIAGIATLISLVISRDRLRFTFQPPVVLLILLVLWMCFTTAVAISPVASWPQLEKVLKIQLMTFVALAALHTRKHLELLLWVCVISIGFYGFKGGLFTIATGGGSRVWGPPGGFIEGNNELAVALVMTIPLMNYLREVATRRWIRLGMLLMMLLCAVSALGTQSRGALLAITAMTAVLWFRSHRKFVSGVFLFVLAIGLIAFMPESWEQRMGTIVEYQGDGSAMGRLGAWQFAMNVAAERPTGGGFGVYTPENYAVYSEIVMPAQAAHSIYFGMLAEHGYIGLCLFVLVWVSTLRLAARLRKLTKGHDEVAWIYALAGMCQVSLVGYLVGGAFLQLAYFDFAYILIVVLVVADRWLKDRAWEGERTGPFGSGMPIFRRERPHLGVPASGERRP